jgi:NifB/MoaA-like Fe-S oxidoreductase
MAPLMPELLRQLRDATGAIFETIPASNSLFGPTTTTAGLLVAKDIRSALAGRGDLDLALVPAESMNDRGVFLDDATFEEVERSLPMPVRASYDFVDVLGSLQHRSAARDVVAA